MKNLLIPKKSSFKKFRCGNKRDGGYIFAETPIKKQNIYGFGVDNDISCEIDLHDHFKGNVYLFDGSCDYNRELPNMFYYNKTNVTKDNINSIIEINVPSIVKMDIEGGEFECLNYMREDFYENIEQFVIEFHLDETNLNQFFEAIEKLQKHYKLIHLHGNNCCGLLSIEIPKILELTFLNKKMCTIDEIDFGPFPDKNLDYKNIDSNDELYFQWW